MVNVYVLRAYKGPCAGLYYAGKGQFSNRLYSSNGPRLSAGALWCVGKWQAKQFTRKGANKMLGVLYAQGAGAFTIHKYNGTPYTTTPKV